MAQQFTAEQMMCWIEAQVAMGPRRPGSAGGHQNEDYLLKQLQEFGLEAVRKEPMAIGSWSASRMELELLAGRSGSLRCFALPYCAFTPEEGIEAPLIYVDPRSVWLPPSCKGAIVVTDICFPVLNPRLFKLVGCGAIDREDSIKAMSHPATFVRQGWHIYRRAVKQGAAGFIGILRDQPGGSCEMWAPYGFKEKNILDKPLPGLWVGRGQGELLREQARSGAGRARITIRGSRGDGVTHNIVGELPGESEECLVLSCHHDSPFASAVEDASGVSVVLALARHFAERRDLRRRLIVLLSAGHFYGSIGTRSFIEGHPDVVARTALEISIEHIALEAEEDASGKLIATGRPEPAGIFVPFNRTVPEALLAAAERHGLDRLVALPAEGPLGDYPTTDGGDWWAAGVPLVNFISNPVYLLTSDDALRWVDRENLPRVAAAFADFIRQMDRTEAAEIAANRRPFYKLAMKGLKHLMMARTTGAGLRPVV